MGLPLPSFGMRGQPSRPASASPARARHCVASAARPTPRREYQRKRLSAAVSESLGADVPEALRAGMRTAVDSLVHLSIVSRLSHSTTTTAASATKVSESQGCASGEAGPLVSKCRRIGMSRLPSAAMNIGVTTTDPDEEGGERPAALRGAAHGECRNVPDGPNDAENDGGPEWRTSALQQGQCRAAPAEFLDRPRQESEQERWRD